MNKKILIIFILGIFLFSLVSVSATLMSYEKGSNGNPDLKVKLDNTFLGVDFLWKTSEIGTAELKSHPSVNYILHVGAGNQVTMYYDFDFKELKKDGLGDVTFTDKRTGKEVERSYNYVYWGNITKEIQDYKEEILITKNGTKEIHYIPNGTHTEIKEGWIDYNSKDIPDKKIRIGIKTEVKIDDFIDGVWEIEGKKISKHSSWTADLNVDLVSYYKFDEGASGGGTIIDSVGNYNLTNSPTGADNTTGKIGSAYDYPNNDAKYIRGIGANVSTSTPYSWGCWVRVESIDGGGDFAITNNFNTQPYSGAFYYNGGGGEISYPISLNTWYFYTFVDDGSVLKYYRNAVNVVNASTGTTGTGQFLTFGNREGLDRAFDGQIDECFFYTRALSNAEVTQLYNGGSGITYTNQFNQLDITLISPEDNANSTSNQINFSVNVSDPNAVGITNVSLLINGAINQINTSGIEGVYNFSNTFADGDYNWSILAFDNEDNSVQSDTRTFSIDTTPFIEFLTPPTLPNYANITSETIPIGVNVSTDYFFNISYDLYNINGTSFNQYYETETYDYNFTNIPDSHYHYDVTVCTTTGQCNTTETRHVNHDVTPPEINVSSPTGTYDYLYVGQTLDLNFTVTDSLANVSSCWYNYNGTNNSVACTNGTLVNVPFALENNNNNLTVYSNDTFGNVGSEFISWNYKVLETAKEYNNETLEGTFETFKLYLTKGAGVNVQSVVLHYDGQTDTSSLFSSGSETRAESELFINEVLADTNNTLYFTVTLSDSTVFNTTNATQLVRNIELDDCSSQPDLFLTLNLLDEANQSAINGDIELYLSIINPDNFEEVLSFNDTYNGVSTKTFCSNIFLNESSFLLGAKIRYDSDNHSAEFYNIQRSNLSSYPKEYNLYDLKDEDTTKFKLIYRGENLIGVVDAIIQLQREYISEGVYKIVEAPLTSSDSTAVVHIDTNTNSYKATVVKDGVVLNTFDNLVFICQSELTGECTLDLQDYIVPPNSVSIENIQDFSYSISSDIDNKTITLDYSVPTGTTSSITVVASQKDIVGENTICNTTVSSAGGSIECAYNDSIQDSYIYYNIYKDGVQLVQKSYIVKDDLRDDFGGDNYFILIIFTISLVFMAILSPEWIVLNSIIAVIIGGATWLIRGMDFVLGLGAIAWLLLGAIIIIIKMAQKEDQ